MGKSSASPSTLSLIAQLGAIGGAVSGWRALLWLVRLMVSTRATDGTGPDAAGLWAMLWRIASGRVKLRGFDVREYSEHYGCTHIRVVEISMRGAPGKPCVFAVRIEFVDEMNVAFVPWRSCVRRAGAHFVEVSEKFGKIARTASSNHALIVPVC